MNYGTPQLLIGGKWSDGSSGQGQAVINPANEEVLARVPHADIGDMDRALTAAQTGFTVWSSMTAYQRQEIMERAARLIEERREQFATVCSLEMGKPIRESRMEADFVAGVTRWYGEEGKRAYGRVIPSRIPGARQLVLKEPVGPVAAFTAWNFPGTNAIRKIAGALGAGCSIIIKPSEETPMTAVLIAKAFQDAGLPDGVINIIFGEPDLVSRHLIASPITRKLTFTGSVQVGRHLQKLAAESLMRCTLELGGHAPVLIFDDADIELAASQMVASKFRNAGQVCISPTRFYIQRKVYSDFVDVFVEKVRTLKVDDGMKDDTDMGPLVAERRLGVMDRLVQDAVSRGATVATGGERIGNRGFYYKPTVLRDVPENAAIMNDEPFGPLAPMTPFDEVDEAISKANRLSVGLAAYAYTRNNATAEKLTNRINAGVLGINNFAVALPETPFGGVDESGYGSEGGIEGLEAYLRTRFVTEVRT
ncbi:NAD-dependent succinate-semialdehyde dehydrogenase [Tardiphaga robiniae]|uniref:NAD-dependent succinate-semialdehyde dehydrogenase n=1 Tax=Tardiphaga robiniae TaxID=943830 RepID=UPI00158622D4|nr:NAD-dependent succinate-semialdehyde dehydrogenase [Tardiphaga robiniae]NUU42605.1 NAD-dependent succinate-semialdehyde dehydrogenase [Tardiphaga robiniae]